jgi:hypothetical protein
MDRNILACGNAETPIQHFLGAVRKEDCAHRDSFCRDCFRQPRQERTRMDWTRRFSPEGPVSDTAGKN